MNKIRNLIIAAALISMPIFSGGDQVQPSSRFSIAALHSWREYFVDNFVAVQTGKCYRSKQLSAEKLEFYIKKYGITTVINLRDEQIKNPQLDWYTQQTARCALLNVYHIDCPLSTTELPSAVSIRQLLTILQSCNDKHGAVLIHCRRGADRTSLGAALWKFCIMKTTKEEAFAQISPKYGHWKWFHAAVIDEFFAQVPATHDQLLAWLNTYAG